MANLRGKLRVIAELQDHWAGIPMPLKDLNLIIEPSYPNGAALMAVTNESDSPATEVNKSFRLRNDFWSATRRRRVYVFEQDGKVGWGCLPSENQAMMMLNTLEACSAWGVEEEANAMQTLGGLVKHYSFKAYCMTGTFMETSKRSGVHYVFRRLRPTLALSTKSSTLRVIAALCLHPIAYYENSWAGAMCPTDDVIAHLMLMRGDEHLFWRRANQHPAWVPQAGIG